MNIKDVKEVPVVKDKLLAIFAKQTELMEKYQEIEKMPNWPMEIDSRESQKWFKDFFWRCTEELCEAWECIEEDREHFEEEIADALHFLVEAYIIAGTKFDIELRYKTDNADYLDILYINCEELPPFPPAILLWNTVYRIGLVGNTLKNKPWKQSEMLTDKKKFHECMNATLRAFIMMCKGFNIDADHLYDLYFRKSEVNKFRQRSNY